MNVQDIINRLYRTYLYPPDYQPIVNFTIESITSTSETVKLGVWAIPEDENLLRVGTILQIDKELTFVTDYDENLKVVTIRRGVYGTTAVEHLQNEPVVMSPPYAAQSVYEAIKDNINTLYPKLWTVSTDNLVEIGNGIAPIGDDLAVEVISVWTDNFTATPNIHAEIVDYHPAVGGRALITNVPAGSIWVRWRRRMGKVEATTDELEDLGVDEAWVNIVMVGAAADLMAGRDIPRAQSEWVSQTLEAENVQVGTRASLSVGLARYRELLIERAQREMEGEYKPKIRMRNPSMDNTRVGIG